MKRLIVLLAALALSMSGVGCDDSDKSCVDDGEVYLDGETWTCSDGCNTCHCDNGVVSSTTMWCGDGGPDGGS